MEPTLPTPNTAPRGESQNSAESPVTGAEANPGRLQETGPAKGPEAGELPLQSQPDPTATAQQAAQAAQDAAAPTAPVDDQQQPQSTAAPLIADNDDLIEKEWVAKAKQIVTQTRNDPHMQEKEVSRLQADYLKKRFGKDIKLVDI